jgi:hypothetical protein
MVTIIKQGLKKDSITKLLNRLSNKPGKGIDTHKYSGLIRLKRDPLDIQKELRNEWE